MNDRNLSKNPLPMCENKLRGAGDRWEKTTVAVFCHAEKEHLLQICQWRKKMPPPIRKLRRIQIQDKATYPKKVELEVEKISTLLRDVSELDLGDSLYLVRQIVFGFEILFEKFGCVDIARVEAGVTSSGQCRIWLSDDVISVPILSNEQIYGQAVFQNVTENIFGIIKNCYQRFIKNLFDHVMASEEKLTFFCIQKKIKEYTSERKINIPNFLKKTFALHTESTANLLLRKTYSKKQAAGKDYLNKISSANSIRCSVEKNHEIKKNSQTNSLASLKFPKKNSGFSNNQYSSKTSIETLSFKTSKAQFSQASSNKKSGTTYLSENNKGSQDEQYFCKLPNYRQTSSILMEKERREDKKLKVNSNMQLSELESVEEDDLKNSKEKEAEEKKGRTSIFSFECEEEKEKKGSANNFWSGKMIDIFSEEKEMTSSIHYGAEEKKNRPELTKLGKLGREVTTSICLMNDNNY